ncbi:DUF560 domain-containing protein [Muribacter muris]|uniref:DUF560 domain-containing protein n=1 Tax=Muribacter muris TaxID=67855 RepID=A0A4Y9K0T7_9PAST|nr:porin family protein [Muribacter muris]MBF0784705.1 DUF560 domain-containing protein [Muribacter muris]MBF0827848.1 DUF560 domain-containing protein [Muribacter muris]TFV11132.1 DUF560 domain-containing protein [Muribacter muris]
MKSSYFFPCAILTLACLPPALWANPPELEVKVATPDPRPQAVRMVGNFANFDPAELKTATTKELRENPELTRTLLNRVIDSGQFHLLPDLLAIYRQTAQPDPILIDYSEAILFGLRGEYRRGIALYQRILAAHPDFDPVRFRLAQILFDDRQHRAAADHFRRLQAVRLPPQIATLTTQYLAAIAQRSQWQFHFGVNYLQENNVNNASADRYIYLGNVPFEKTPDSLPQKAHGLNYVFNAEKSINLVGSHYAKIENNFHGKTFWDNYAYDDQSDRLSVGYQYLRAKTGVALLPFYEMRWYGNHRYNRGYGVRGELNHWFSPKWQLSLAAERGELKHRAAENRAADGHNLLLSATLLHLLNANSYLYLGSDYLADRPREAAFGSDRKTVRLGWGQAWWGGISSRVQLSYGKRDFLALHKLFLQVRHDKEWAATLTLWKRDFYYWGITPKLTFSYNKVKSNLAQLYSTEKKRLFLSLEKAF